MARLLRPLTKIRSVMPAAAASSTANWISGLSTMGSISFGLALVAGRKRLPSPATGNTALVSLPNAMEEVLELFFVDHRYTELAGAVELASRLGAGHDIVRLLRHAAGDLAATPLDQFLRFLAGERWQGPGQDERLAGELPCQRALRCALRPLYPGRAQLGNHLAIVRLGEELADALRQHRPHVGNLLQRRLVASHERVESAKVPRQLLRGCLADVANTQGEDKPRQCRLAALVDGGDDVGRRFLRHALELAERGNTELVQVGRRAHDMPADQLFNELLTEAFDVHGAAAGEVQQRLRDLGRADQAARAARDGFVRQAHHRRTAFGTFFRQRKLARTLRPLFLHDA